MWVFKCTLCSLVYNNEMAILSIVDEEYLTSYTARRRNTVNETCKQKLCIIVSFKKMN